MISKYLKGRLRSFSYAFHGIAAMWKREKNIRIHAAAAVMAIALGLLLRISAWEWCAVIIVIGMVFAAETFNTAIERTVDLASPEKHPIAEESKDIAAAAVLITAITSVIIGLIIFLPKLILLF